MTKLMRLHCLYNKCSPVSIGHNHIGSQIYYCVCGRFYIGRLDLAISSTARRGSPAAAVITALCKHDPAMLKAWSKYQALVHRIWAGTVTNKESYSVAEYFKEAK